MNIQTQVSDPLSIDADALVLPASPGETGLQSNPELAAVEAALGGELARIAADTRFSGKPGTTLTIPTLGRLPARRVVLAGIGASAGRTPEMIRRGYGRAATAARDVGASHLVATFPPASDGIDGNRALSEAVEGAVLALYRFDRYYGAARADQPAPLEVDDLTFAATNFDANESRAAIEVGSAAAAGISLARDLANEPGSVLNPVTMEERARQVAAEQQLEITVLGPTEMEALGMGAILAVGKGSAVEPRLIHLIYRPAEVAADTRQIGLVGKCITFDTGGYSIKPYEGMLEMKGDMAGGAAVLGAMQALRAAGVRHVVHGVICAAENMISGDAFRPGDILTAMNGVTIEVLSTDAEGRLVLADGLVYTARQGAQELIDLATLTGAVVVALGDGTAGLFTNDDALADRLTAAASRAGERVWRMPLTEELEEQIKGDVGDIKNTGGRAGGAITAALFIQHFDEGLPWAHLDIAGCNRTTKGGPYTPKGATGWGVRTLLEYLTAD